MKLILGPKFADDWWQACCNYQEGRFKGQRSIDYFVFATRMSGESTTTFGNTVINWCLSDFISHSLHIDYYTLPAGDDGLTGCNTTDLDSISRIYTAVGLKTKIKLVEWNDASFLSCRFVADQNGQYRMVRDVVKALVKLPWTVYSKYSRGWKRIEYLRAKILSLCHEFAGFDFFVAMYK